MGAAALACFLTRQLPTAMSSPGVIVGPEPFENYDAHRPPPIDGIPPDQRDLVNGLAALQKGNAGSALWLLQRALAVHPEDAGLAALVAELKVRVETHPL